MFSATSWASSSAFPDLLDVDEDLVGGELPELLPEGLHFRATFSDQDPGARRVDVDDDLLAGPIDHDLRDSGVEELLLDELPDLVVLVDLLAVAALLEPVGLPPVERAQTESVGVNLLSQDSLPLLSVLPARE